MWSRDSRLQDWHILDQCQERIISITTTGCSNVHVYEHISLISDDVNSPSLPLYQQLMSVLSVFLFTIFYICMFMGIDIALLNYSMPFSLKAVKSRANFLQKQENLPAATTTMFLESKDLKNNRIEKTL